jgi:hypothetical protein
LVRCAVFASFLLAATEVATWKASVASEDEASDSSWERSVSEGGAGSMLDLPAGSKDTCTDKDMKVRVGVRLEAATGLEAGQPLLAEGGDLLEVLPSLGIAAGPQTMAEGR